jgi:hypothetical protein
MNPFLVFNVQVTLAIAVVALATRWYLAPVLRRMDPAQARAVPLLVSSLRFMGLAFLLPNLAVAMPPEFAIPSGYGDFAVSLLALAGAVANHYRTPLGAPLAWAYLVLGGGDLAYGFLLGFRYGMWDHLAGGWAIVMFVAPLVITSLGTLAWLLLAPVGERTPRTSSVSGT